MEKNKSNWYDYLVMTGLIIIALGGSYGFFGMVRDTVNHYTNKSALKYNCEVDVYFDNDGDVVGSPVIASGCNLGFDGMHRMINRISNLRNSEPYQSNYIRFVGEEQATTTVRISEDSVRPL